MHYRDFREDPPHYGTGGSLSLLKFCLAAVIDGGGGVGGRTIQSSLGGVRSGNRLEHQLLPLVQQVLQRKASSTIGRQLDDQFIPVLNVRSAAVVSVDLG
jgi:hypothetical protein